MVHLATAVRMHELESSIPNHDFLLGSIAPDAIHMRPGDAFQDKLRVHLSDVMDLRYERARDLYMGKRMDDTCKRDFSDGYVAHLLTDYLWQERIIRAFHEGVPQDISPTERRLLYYRETDQIDFDLYHRMPWREDVWCKLTFSEPRDFNPFLTAGEINQWRDRVLHWFGEIKQAPEIEPVYITYAETLDFIDKAAIEIGDRFKKWEEKT